MSEMNIKILQNKEKTGSTNARRHIEQMTKAVKRMAGW